MSELWERSRPFLVAILVWLIGGVAFYLFVHLPFSGSVRELRADNGTAIAEHFAPEGQAPKNTFADVEKAAQDERRQLEAALEAATKQVEFRPRPEISIPANAVQRAYEYTKLRDRVAAELRELANKASLRIPYSLDPRTDARELPRESEADELLFRLGMSDRIIRDAVAASIGTVVSISHNLGAPQGTPFAERTVKVRIEASLDDIVRFIEKSSQPPKNAEAGGGMLVIRSIELESTRGTALAAQIELAALKMAESSVSSITIKATAQPQPGVKARRSY